MIWIGHPAQKFVGYPIADLDGGRLSFNFIAELRPDDATLADREDWNRRGDLADFLPAFETWVFDCLDVPALVRAAPQTFVYPMVDRDPVDRWTFGRVTLLGDAAPPDVPDRIERRVAGHPRCPRAGRVHPVTLRCRGRARTVRAGPPAATRSEIDEITEGYRRTAGFVLAALDDPTSLADRAY